MLWNCTVHTHAHTCIMYIFATPIPCKEEISCLPLQAIKRKKDTEEGVWFVSAVLVVRFTSTLPVFMDRGRHNTPSSRAERGKGELWGRKEGSGQGEEIEEARSGIQVGKECRKRERRQQIFLTIIYIPMDATS